MSVLDPRLKFLQSMEAPSYTEAGAREYFRIDVERTPGPTVRVMAQYTGEVAPLTAAGLRVRAVVGDVITGDAPISQLDAIAAVPGVVRMEAARTMQPELDTSATECRVTPLRSATPPVKGAGVIVGVIDTGIDFTHACFRKADGTSRILFLWDHWLTPTGTEASPTPYGYGVEYTKANIDAALATATPTTSVRHTDGDTDDGHGTHVAGIAAGNGRASAAGQAANTFIGVAPEADLIIVANRSGGAMGDSAQTLEAIQYIFEKAAAAGKPCSINLSQGDNVGPHDGTSLLERGIDNLLGGAGRVMVKSAGNAGDDRIHAAGRLRSGTAEAVQFSIQANDSTPETIDIWYAGPDRVDITLTTPGGVTSAVVHPGNAQHVNLANGNRLDVDSRLDDPWNHDNRIFVQLARGTAATIQSGTWTINLTATTLTDGRFHAWIDRGGRIARFISAHETSECTISIPGTSREVIAVGSYVTHDDGTGFMTAPIGQLSTFSSRGPTRDGRIKPEIAAPGESIFSARATGIANGTGVYHYLMGTSMASPQVAGACALILEKNPRLTARQIKAGLQDTARADANTATLPNGNFGYGKVDVQAAVTRTYATPLSENWVRMQPLVGNWPAGPSAPSFDLYADENGTAVVELAWDPQALLAPSLEYTGAEALRYYTTAVDFQKTITKADGSQLAINVPRQDIRLQGNRATWTIPTALWNGYVEEVLKVIATPPRSTFSCNLYYRIRLQAPAASAAVVWPPDSVIRANPSAPHLGLLRVSATPPSRTIPDAPAVAQMGGMLFFPNLFGSLLTWLWNDLPETDESRRSLAAVFEHSVYRTEMTNVRDRAALLNLWLFAGTNSRRRLTRLLERRVWSTGDNTIPAVLCRDLRGGATLLDNLLAMLWITPHPDMVGITSGEQLVDDVLTEILDPNGQINQGRAGTCAPTAIQTLLIDANPSEYARLQRGLLSAAGVVELANGSNAEVPPAIFQVARYAGTQSSPFYVRTNAELAFQATVMKYAQGSRFPTYDPAAAPDAPTGVNTVFQSTISGGLTKAEIERAMEGLFGRGYTASASGPTAAVRDGLLTAMDAARRPMLLALIWGGAPGTAAAGGHAVIVQRIDSGRVFFKNPQYAGSTPPSGAQVGASRDNPPRRYEDPTATLESMGDADLASWILWYYTPDTTA